MRIGIDIDGVLTNIEQFQREKGKLYFKKELANEKGFDIKEMFNCSSSEMMSFWKKYLLSYSIKEPAREGFADVIKELHDEGNHIQIITSRYFTDKDDALGIVMKNIVKQWLSKNNIVYDEITFCGEDKSETIKKDNINVMIEDNINNINNLSKITNVIKFNNSYNEEYYGEIASITEPKELKNVIMNLQDKLNKNIVDPITVKSGKMSIDRPHKSFYSIDQTSINLPKMSIYDYLYESNKNNLFAEAISYFGKKMTFKEFFTEIDKCCKALIAKGIKEKDIVTICMPNTPEGVIAFYAVNKIGAVANMIHPLSSEKEIEYYLNESNSKLVISIDMCFNKINSILPKTNVDNVVLVSPADSMPLQLNVGYNALNSKVVNKVQSTFANNDVARNKFNNKIEDNIEMNRKLKSNMWDKWDDFIKAGKSIDKFEKHIPKENEMAVLLHTGGSTGSPKAVMLSNENFNCNTEQLKFTIPSYKKGDKLFAITPIFHGFGLADCVHTALCVNMSVILLPQFDEKMFTNIMLKEKPTLLLGVPTLFSAMIKNKAYDGKDLSYFKVLISGGDTLPKELEERINVWLKEHNCPNKVFKGIGMTESLAATAFSTPNANKLSCVGIPLPQNNYKIVKMGTTEEVEPYENGEICVTGPSVMLGYYNNEKETNDTLKIHEDGKTWLHTGDAGYVDNEGVVFYTQRIKRIIIASGYNIYPVQIENLILTHPAIEKCAVVAEPHEYKVNVPKVYIVVKEGYQESNELIEELRNLCKNNLSKFSLPKNYEFRKQLPQTLLNKIDYKLLEEEASINYYSNNSKKTR